MKKKTSGSKGRTWGEEGGGGETATWWKHRISGGEPKERGEKNIYMWCKVCDYSVAAGEKKQGWEERRGEGGKGEIGRDKL